MVLKTIESVELHFCFPYHSIMHLLLFLRTLRPEERVLIGVFVAIHTVLEDDNAAMSPNVRDMAVVLEETNMLHDLPDLCTAFCIPRTLIIQSR